MARPPTMPPGVSIPGPPPAPEIPPLENGDRLTRAEFERRYHAMPHLKKAELIEGVVHTPSPVRLEQHGEPHLDFVCWMGFYRTYTPFVRGGDNTTVRLDLDNEPQPDGVLFWDPVKKGRVRIDADGYVVGGPDLAAEITSSMVSIDLGSKLQVYRRNEVLEYVVWRVLEKEIDWFILRQGTYERLALSLAGYYQSEVFPGLWLDPAAMVAGDLVRVNQVLQKGLQSPEHAACGARLQDK